MLQGLKNLKGKKAYTIVKTLFLTLLFLTLSSLITSIIPIDINNLSSLGKNIYLIVDNLIFLLILYISYKDKIINDFKNYYNNNFLNNFEVSFKYWFIGIVIMVISNLLILFFTDAGLSNNEVTVRQLVSKYPAYIFSVCIYAPLSEELIFRHSFKEVFKKKYVYILASGFIFGALHVISSINTWQDWLHLIPYCSLGIAFSSLYYKTDNIFSTITMHALHNTMTLLLVFIGSGI